MIREKTAKSFIHPFTQSVARSNKQQKLYGVKKSPTKGIQEVTELK